MFTLKYLSDGSWFSSQGRNNEEIISEKRVFAAKQCEHKTAVNRLYS